MDLKIKDVAELLNVSETTIRRWLTEGKIPAYRLNSQYRFSRNEIEDWVMSQRLGEETGTLPFEEDFEKNNVEYQRQENDASSQGTKQYSLYRAIHKGGVFHQIPGDNKEAVIFSTMQCLAQSLDLDADVLTELLLDRERLMPTALNNGIAVPHTRDFLLSAHFDAIAVVFPQKPINYGALDGNPVHTMFFLFACEDKRHLHLLAKLAHLSSQPEAMQLLSSKPDKKSFLAYVRKWESQI